MTPQEYAVRAVRAWITNLDLDTVPELRAAGTEHPQGAAVAERRDRFIEQVLNATQEMVGVLTYAVIAERQDEEWERFRVDWNAEGVTDLTYPVRFTTDKEIVR